MVVDDEKEIRNFLTRALEREGYSVVVSPDGRTALAMMQEHQPDLVILDIMMPDLDGFQVLDIIRQRSNVPVIMLTGRGEMTTLHAALGLGADDFVRKPFHMRELLARIKAKLRRSGPELSVCNDEGKAHAQ
jgi:two-component system response regulator VicR